MDFLPTYSNLFLLAFICILKKLRLLLLDTVDLHHHSVTNEITCWVECCHAVFSLSLYSGFRVQQRIQLWLCPSHKGLVVHCLSPPPPAWTLSSIQQHYTVFLLVFTCLHSMAPIYIFTLLHPFTLLPICSPLLMQVLLHGWRALSAAGPELWNAKPQGLRQCTSVAPSKVQLQTHLCRPAPLSAPNLHLRHIRLPSHTLHH